VRYRGSATRAYASAPSWPVGRTQPLYLSGSSDLVTSARAVRGGDATFVAPPGGLPASYSETSAVQERDPLASLPPADAPGQYAAFTTTPLAAPADVVGIPTLDVSFVAAASSDADPATRPTVFVKAYDVASDGTQTLVWRLVAPVRIDALGKPLHIYLPGLVHRYATGHRIRLVVATTDQAYTSSRIPHVLSIVNDPHRPNVLHLPVTQAVRLAS
ncbi:MAG: hypothetical protein LC640_13765, partial [Frankia sp.]|nr:hypothetical protein [Frankia sp.]